jgi:hypothetical protein
MPPGIRLGIQGVGGQAQGMDAGSHGPHRPSRDTGSAPPGGGEPAETPGNGFPGETGDLCLLKTKAGELEAHKSHRNHPRQTEKPRTVARKGKFGEGLREWLADFSWVLLCL